MSLYKLGISDKTTAVAQNSDPEVQQMLENAQQNNQIQKPLNDGILDAIKELFGFGSAQSAEMPQVPNLTYRNITPTFDLRTGITNTTTASPFLKSMADIDASGNVNTDLVNQLIEENQKKTNPFDPRNFQSIFPTNVQTGIRQQVPSSNIDLSGLPANMGVANEPDEEQVEYLTEQEPSGITKLFEFLGNIPTPFNLARRGLESLRGLNQRLRNTDFGRSKTLADYFDAKSYGGIDARNRAAQKTMREARAIQRQVDMRGDSTSRVADRNRSSVTRSSAAKSKGVGGGGYTKSDSARESYRGRY